MSTRCKICVLQLVVVWFAGGRLAASEIGIWGVRSPGVEPARVKQLVFELEKVIGGLPERTLVNSAKLQQRLDKAGILPGAPWDNVWPALQLDWIVTGVLTSVGGQLTADLRLINGRQGRELRRVTMELDAEAGNRPAQIEELAVRLVAPDKWKGSLLVETSVPGARVYLGDRQVAVTPLEKPLENITPGKHILRVVKDGYADFSHFVHVRYNRLVQLKVSLENSLIEGLLYQNDAERPPPPPEKAAEEKLVLVRPSRLPAWLALGAALAAGGVGAGLWVADKKAPAAVLVSAAGIAAAGSVLALVLAWPDDEESRQRDDKKSAALPAGFMLLWSGSF